MPRRGEYGDTTQRCAYCGKPETTWMWSNYQGRYCSFRCLAADNYVCYSLFLCCLIPLSIMMYVAMLNLAAGTANLEFFDMPSQIMLSILVWSFTASCFYSIYIGYTTDRETNLDDISKQLPPEPTNYD